ncbi:MAG: ABC transporter permease [Fuerstiella sp.]
MFVRDLSAQYRQTYFGYLWAFLPPLVASLTFIFLQGQGIVNAEGVGMPYAAFAMIGTLLFQTFVESIQSPVTAVINAKPMLSKINFPREAILMGGLYMVVFNFLIRLLMLAGVMAIWHVTPGWTLLLFPLVAFGMLLCGFAVGMALLPIGTLYQDVGKVIPIVAQFWMLLTPVVYPAQTEGLAGWLATWNPISPLLATARATLTGQPLTFLPAATIVTISAFMFSVAGLVAFRLVLPRLIERMGG